MILDATTRKLQAALAGAVAANQLPIVAHWVDMTATATTPGSSNTVTNGVTLVDIVPAPAATTQRVVQGLSVFNKDTANATVTISYNDNGTTREIVKVLLQPSQSLIFRPGVGWQVVTATPQGGNRASFRGHKGGTDQTGIASGVVSKLTFTTEVFDVGSYYDAANSKWTPPAGKVLLAVSIAITGGGVVAGNTFGVLVYKNGAMLAQNLANAATSSGTVSPAVTVVDDANGTDYYEVYMYGDGVGTKTVYGGVASSFFSGTAL